MATKILVLWRQPDVLVLWGIPYRMRPGQQPYDLWKAHRDYVPPAPGHYGAKQISIADWVWLGSPGWWNGYISKERRAAIEAFVGKYPTLIPQTPCEWTDLVECGVELDIPE